MSQSTISGTGVRRPKALVFAYSAEPGKGSEPGGGWGVVMALSQVADLTVLVKSEHMEGIRKWETRFGGAGLQFIEVKPGIPRALHKLHRITEFLTYLYWLRAAARISQRMHLKEPFDFVHHVTYSVYWLPTPATKLGIPCVLGPVGGGVRAPRVLWPILGIGGLFDELLDGLAVALAARFPSTRRGWREASVRIVQNEETLARMPADLREETHVLNSGLLTQLPTLPSRGCEPVVVFPSALISRKCPRLALEALVHAPRVRLQFVHTGPQEPMLRRLAARYGLEGRVEFLGQIPRGELFERLAGASAAIFTGVREEGGLALAEAMSLGTPVVVLSVGGARTICEGSIDPSRVALVDPAAPEGVALGLARAMEQFVIRPPVSRTSNLACEAAERRLHRLVEQALGQPPGSVASATPDMTSGSTSDTTANADHEGDRPRSAALRHDQRSVASATGGDR